jgi:hypothetical protein
MNSTTKQAAINALSTFAYILGVVTLLSHAEQIFGPDEPKSVVIPLAMLSLFVFSAALTSFLVFGRPVLWYLDGKKKEAVSLLSWTLGIFFSLTVLAFVAVFLSNGI